MLNEFVLLHSLDWSISQISGVWLGFINTCFIEFPVVYADNVDPDQV